MSKLVQYLCVNRFLIIAMFIFSACGTSNAQSTNTVATNDVVKIKVTVLDAVPLTTFKGSITPTDDVSPRFALTLRIESSVPAVAGLKPGTVVTFAVHSPSRFVSGDAKKGQTYEIEMPRKKAVNLI